MKRTNVRQTITAGIFLFAWQCCAVTTSYAQDKREKNIPVKLLDLTFAMPKKTSIGRVNASNYSYDERATFILGEESFYRQAVCNALEGEYMLVRECYWEEPPEFKFIVKESVCIHPVLKKINFSITESKKGYYEGRTTGTIDWYVTENNQSNDTLYKVSIPLSLTHKYFSTKGIIDSLVGESAKRMLEIDSLYEKIVAVSASYVKESVTNKDAIEIEKVSAPKFKSQKEFSGKIAPAVVTITLDDGFGSGFIISKEGHVLTNYHVVKTRDHVKVKLNMGITLEASVLRTNPDYDMALLMLDGSDFSALSIGNSDSSYIGENVFAVGTAADMLLDQSMTKGIISGRRTIEEREYIQTDVSINAGNSGGPLLDENGEVIGIVTAKKIGRGVEGIGFAIPINEVVERLSLKLK